MEESEGLRRDGAWEHGVLQQRPAGEAPLHDPPHVCLLMLVGTAQVITRGRQERPVQALVLAAMQVREKHAARASYVARLPNLVSVTRIYVDSGKYGGLVRLCGVMRWAAGLLYAPRGDEEAGGGPHDGLRDLGVRVTALVQRAACECSDACRCCQLPANALALALNILVVELRQNIHTLRSCLCILYSSTASTASFVCVCVWGGVYVCVCVCIYICFTPALTLLHT